MLWAVWHRATSGTPWACCGPFGSFFGAVFGACWLTWTPAGAARACFTRVARPFTGEWVPVSTTRWHAATSEGVTEGAGSSAAAEQPGPEKAVALRSQSDGSARAYEIGWLWPLRMTKRVSGRATRGGERRNTAESGHRIRGARLERSLTSAWPRWARFSGARALGGSSAR